jgi:hypothetical protein
MGLLVNALLELSNALSSFSLMDHLGLFDEGGRRATGSVFLIVTKKLVLFFIGFR